jgi:S1-C subfamily serine protease
MAKPRSTARVATSAAAPPRGKPPSAAEAVEIAQGLVTGLARIGGLDQVDALLDRLKECREFTTLAALAAALADHGSPLSVHAMRVTAQAHIELGRFSEARVLLDEVIGRAADDCEALEAHGLRGRIHKQLYVNESVRGVRKPELLRSAVHEYLKAYDEDPRRPGWHGINSAALLARAVRDRVSGLPVERRLSIASDIRDRLLASSGADAYWEMATLAEASLVLGDLDTAELWFHRAAWLPEVAAFARASTLRQLREVWQLDPATLPGSRILPPLDARLHQAGQSLLISPRNLAGPDSAPRLEKVFGSSPFMPFEAWAMGIDCAKSVCRVENQLNQGFGTGFIVNGRLLSAKLPNEPVLVTNAHVLTRNGDGGALTPAQAHVAFYASTDRNGRPHVSTIGKILWSSPPDRFDATIASLRKPLRPAKPLSLATGLPAPGGGEKVYVVGHPKGGGLVFSLNDNELLDHGDPDDFRVHYKTPTEPGSSGSPVFNAQWELIALHHAGSSAMRRIHGSGSYSANEGIAFRHIGPAIRLR